MGNIPYVALVPSRGTSSLFSFFTEENEEIFEDSRNQQCNINKTKVGKKRRTEWAVEVTASSMH